MNLSQLNKQQKKTCILFNTKTSFIIVNGDLLDLDFVLN